MNQVWRIESADRSAVNNKFVCCTKEEIKVLFSKYTFVGDDELLCWKIEGNTTEFITVKPFISLDYLRDLV